MPYRISDAREQVLEHLDDESGARYARETGANTESFRKVDRALRNALSSCVDDYVSAGGDRFNERIEVTTTATDGIADLSDEKVGHIRGVRINSGSSLYRIDGGDVLAGGLPDAVARDLTLTAVRRLELADVADPDDLLLGTTAGVARSWDAFDEWVCARASDALGAKDDETRKALLRTLERCERSVMQHKRTPSSRPWPARSPSDLFMSGRLRWLWFPREQELQLVIGSR